MAAGTTPRPGRALVGVALAVIALYALVFLGQSHSPQLGLDLRGGTSVTLTPRVATGKGKVTNSALNKAVEIIRSRVNSTGVAEAEVRTEGSNVVVSVPGGGRAEVLRLVGRTAQLRFRQVLTAAAPGPAPSPSASPSGSGTPAPAPSGSPSRAPTPSPTSNGRVLPAALAASSAAPTPTPPASRSAPAPTPSPSASVPGAAVTAADQQRFAAFTCSSAEVRKAADAEQADAVTVACDRQDQTKYLLAPAQVLGTQVSGATATIDPNGLGGWRVQLDFNGTGEKRFGDLTKAVTTLPDVGSGCAPPQGCNAVAVVLDGVVESAPRITEPILNGRAEITGNFSEREAKDLATVLKYGALPLAFDVSTAETISPTLGSDQLRGGLLAGAIGLGLVIVYSLLYYRALGLVTVSSLALSGAIIYAATTLLGHFINYTLTLAGIAGFIVAVGITADSFVVYFERLRDEIREGRTLRSGAERAWIRARRTILSADTVSLLAAVVLYLVSIGGVRGFAFTLGLSTIVDLFIVFLFTKPLITLLARTKFFGSGGRLSGIGSGRTRPARASGTQEA